MRAHPHTPNGSRLPLGESDLHLGHHPEPQKEQCKFLHYLQPHGIVFYVAPSFVGNIRMCTQEQTILVITGSVDCLRMHRWKEKCSGRRNTAATPSREYGRIVWGCTASFGSNSCCRWNEKWGLNSTLCYCTASSSITKLGRQAS